MSRFGRMLVGALGALALAMLPLSGALTADASSSTGIAFSIQPGNSYQCNAVVGASAGGFNQITYVVDATATIAGSQLITGVTCQVYVNGSQWGGPISGADPGPSGLAHGLVTVPTNATVTVCVYDDTLTLNNVYTQYPTTCG